MKNVFSSTALFSVLANSFASPFCLSVCLIMAGALGSLLTMSVAAPVTWTGPSGIDESGISFEPPFSMGVADC